jgi:hypothetical protein
MKNSQALQFLRARRKRSARLARGAALVESAVVISLLTLGLMGLMYFRGYYIKQMLTTRLARASILAYSMSGCEGQGPKDWIGAKDRQDLTVGAPDENKEPATGKNQNAAATSKDGGANGFMSGLGLSGDGRGVLNPITNLRVTGKVTLKSKTGTFAAEQTVFSGEPGARSFVTCGEKMRDGNVGELVSMLMGKLGSLVHFK